jgi:mono/diheme cytochrome c family protein
MTMLQLNPKIGVILFTLATLISCGNNSSQSSGSSVADTEKSTLQSMQDHPGKRVYDQYCKACHMADGTGIKGLHPPLKDNKTVNDTDKLIEVTLKGMTGKIVVDGVEYNGIMPPHTHLTNQQIADVLSYVRQNFSGNAAPVTAAEVAKFR